MKNGNRSSIQHDDDDVSLKLSYTIAKGHGQRRLILPSHLVLVEISREREEEALHTKRLALPFFASCSHCGSILLVWKEGSTSLQQICTVSNITTILVKI